MQNCLKRKVFFIIIIQLQIVEWHQIEKIVMMIEISLGEMYMSRCDCHMYGFLTSSIIYLWCFSFTLGIMHVKLITIYIIIPNERGAVFNYDMYFTYTMPKGKHKASTLVIWGFHIFRFLFWVGLRGKMFE